MVRSGANGSVTTIMKTNRMPRRERMLLAGLCGVLGAWIGTTRASDLDPVTLGSSRGDSGSIREIHSIAVSGPCAFLACGDAGMQVLDVRDAARPKAVSRYLTEWHDWADDGFHSAYAPFYPSYGLVIIAHYLYRSFLDK